MKRKGNKDKSQDIVNIRKEMEFSNKKLFLLLLVWSAAVLFLMSPDSPIHGPWNRCDSAIFFTSGKALMNGMRPYVDFADSKGPLLWLAFGVGYLLSPLSYTGIYIVSCFLYAGIFYYNFKTARIFLKDNSRSMAVTLLMSFAYFLLWFHFEVRAEDYATLPVAISLYYLFRLLYTEEIVSVRHLGLMLGGCFMALVLIKFSIAAMQALMMAVALWYYVRKCKVCIRPLAWMVVGAVTVALPFLVYLWMRGAVPAFIGEYFVNTLRTISDNNGSHFSPIWGDFAHSLGDPASLSLLLMIVYGGWMLGRELQHYRWVPLLIAIFFYAVATRHNLGYYYGICHIFLIYLFVWSVGQASCPYKTRNLAFVILAVIGWGIYLNVSEGSKLQKVSIWANNEYRYLYESLSDAMSGSRRPRVLNLYWNDDGFGLKHEALPAGRYWTRQLGSTPEMLKEHVSPIIKGKADIILVNDVWDAIRNGWFPGKIISYGYYCCFRDTCANGRVRAVYMKKK